MKTYIYIPVIAIFSGLILISCDVNNENPPVSPTIENVEIGSGNNGIGVIGRDFHFDMDVVAGDLMENVQIKIQQRSDETYSHEWSYEITWDEYNGVKNANVHKHFDIPEGAPEGHYDFIIIVNDQNGTTLEETREVELIDPANLPVDPQIWAFSITRDNTAIYGDGDFSDPNDTHFNQGDTLKSNAIISGVKGDGTMYILLIKKSLDHRPETIDQIDFNKAIVYDVFEHENKENIGRFSNVVFDSQTFTYTRQEPNFIIGSDADNNLPDPNPIIESKSWENGTYYFGILYTNTSHNVSYHHYVELEITGF